MVLGEVSSEIFSFISERGVLWISPEQKSEPILENKPKTIHISENRGIVDNSKTEVPKGLIQCEFCAKQGKPMFFATLEDLKGHIWAFHSGYPDYVR